MGEDEKRKGAFGWFLGKLVRAPAAYLGLAAGIGAGVASAGAGIPLPGAIGGGMIVTFGVGMFAFIISQGILAAHRHAQRPSSSDPVDTGIEEALLAALRSLGKEEIVDLLEKIEESGQAIEAHARAHPDSEDAQHTRDLVRALRLESIRQAAEYEDLARREADPLLESPPQVTEHLERILADLQAGYRALADTRSRLRRGDLLSRTDFLEPVPRGTRLSALATQLQEESDIARGVEARLQPESPNIVFSDEDASSGSNDEPESLERE